MWDYLKKAGNIMRNVWENRKRWKQFVTIVMVAALLFTMPNIVGFASEGANEASTASVHEADATQQEYSSEAQTAEQTQQEEGQQAISAENTTESKSEEAKTSAASSQKNSARQEKSAAGTTKKSSEESTKSKTRVESETKSASQKQLAKEKEYLYQGSNATIAVSVERGDKISSSTHLKVNKYTLNKKLYTQLATKAVGENNEDAVESIRAYKLSFIRDGKQVRISSDINISFSNLGVSDNQNAFIYRIEDEKIKNTNAVMQDGTMTFDESEPAVYAVVTYNKVQDVNGNDITAGYQGMIQAANQELNKNENGNIPITSWERSQNPLVLNNKKDSLTNWKWSDVSGIDLNLVKEEQVWNGSRTYGKASNKYLKSGQVTVKSGRLYDSAIWKNQSKDNSKASMNRFRGEFTVSAKDKTKYSYTLKPVTDSENLYTKDNMFVFVYPKDVELTDDNYMDYLAFWTGSAEKNFNGRTAASYEQRQPVENVSVLTDGWHMESVTDNVGSIITASDAKDFYVDVFTESTSDAGGMYRMKLEQKNASKTAVTFRNLDADAKAGTAGAKFELYKDGVYYTAQSVEDGTVNFNVVTPSGSDTDVYTLKETAAPEGYNKNDTTWKVLINNSGVVSIKDTTGQEMAKYPDGVYVMSSSKIQAEAQTTEAIETETKATETKQVVKHYKSDDVNVTVTAEKESDIPEGAELVVKPVELSKKAEENVEQAAVKEGKRAVKNLLAYDIHFEVNGKEVQPGATVKVSVDVPEITAGKKAMVYHVDDNNKVENMDGSVDKKGDVVFETTHFSTYVIVNQADTDSTTSITSTYTIYNSNANASIDVTIEHYDNTTQKKIYATDEYTNKKGNALASHASINNYAKAENWTVDHILVNGIRKSVAEAARLDLSSDTTVKVYYTAKTQTVDGETTFYDYTVKAGDNYSINMAENYPSGSSKSNRLSVGEPNKNYSNYQYDTTNSSGKHINYWTGQDINGKNGNQIITGLLKGLKADGSPEFNYDDPGLFKNEDAFYTKNDGTKVYTRKVIDNYKLTFSQSGDTYSLQSVKNASNQKVADSGQHFFPLDDIDHSAEKETSNPHDNDYKRGCGSSHNYYFGMRYDVDFTLGDYVGALNYSFTGDDDLWVLLDGKVVLDIGGIHNEVSGNVDLWETILGKTSYTEADKEGLSSEEKAEVHTVTVLYMERGAGQSNCTMNFTLPSAQIVEVTKPKNAFTIHKQGNDGRNLAGAVFELTNNADQNNKYTATTASTGYASFTGLTAGIYTLKETKAPTGYELSEMTWRVTVSADGTVVVTDSSGNNVTTDSRGNYLIYNTKEAQLPAPDHQKYIKKEGDNKYKLTLDVTGKVGEADPIDILLIVDKSASMSKKYTWNNRQWVTSEVDRYKYVNAAINTLIKSLKDAQIRANVNLSVVTFNKTATMEKDWTNLNNITFDNSGQNDLFKLTYDGCTEGTNWQAGVKKGGEVLSTGTGKKQYVVFLTDGQPTYGYDNEVVSGDGTTYLDTYYNGAVNEWKKSESLLGSTKTYVVDAMEQDEQNTDKCPDFALAIGGTCKDGHDADQLKTSFEEITKAIAYPSYNNVTITDTLSEYAQFVNFDNQKRPIISVHKGIKTFSKNSAGTITGIESVTSEKVLTEKTDYTYTYNASTKTIEVKLNGTLEADKTYWVEFDIEPTEKAYSDYLTKGGYSGTKGDLLTDAPNNTTSSGKDGFYSNSSAKVKYKVDDSKGKDADYDDPVIQVKTATTDQVVKKEWIGTKKSSIEVKLTAKAGDRELSNETYKSLPADMQQTLNDKNNWTASWNNLPTKYYYVDLGDNNTIKSTDITYSVDEVSVPEGYVKTISEPVLSEDGKATTTITNREVVIEKVWTDKQTDNRPNEESEVHPESQNIIIGIYKPETNGSEEKPFSNDNLITSITLNKRNDWKSTIPVALGADYKKYVIRELKEDENGSTTIENKKYSVIEDSNNIVVDNASYKVSYSSEDDAQKAYKYTVTNTRLNTITIKKVDGNNNPLDGAEFSLKKKDSAGNWQDISTATSKDGILKFTELEDGEYRITEVKSPTGHSLLANPIDVTLPMTANSTQEGLEKGKGVTKEDEKVYYYDLTYTIKNNKLFDMPAAGGRFKATIIGIAIMIIAAGCYIIRRRRRVI